MDEYERIEKIGMGKYSDVFMAKNLRTGQYVAMKEQLLEQPGCYLPAKATREMNILAELDHRNVVKLLDVVGNEKFVYLVLEYRDMDLSSYLASRHRHFPDIRPDLIKSFMFQILEGVSYCHSKRVVHRDLKPKNILLDLSSKTLKLADFGIATYLENANLPLTQEVITQCYRAPEILLGSTEYTTAVDVWSVGCIFAEIVMTEILFTGNSEIDQLVKIFSLLGTPSEITWPGISSLPGSQLAFYPFPARDLRTAVPRLDPDGADLLLRMLCLDPSCRITAQDALQHEYFGIPDSSSSSSC